LDHSNARRRLACDIFYIRNTSFFLKIKILLLLFRRLIFPAIDDPTDDLFSHRLKK
jgi:lipopolysaccharide/colanic/teichoic acid biosynthesis glycosyltransferase